jgi:hypothetical protein
MDNEIELNSRKITQHIPHLERGKKKRKKPSVRQAPSISCVCEKKIILIVTNVGISVKNNTSAVGDVKIASHFITNGRNVKLTSSSHFIRALLHLSFYSRRGEFFMHANFRSYYLTEEFRIF